jgi:hypothetical protein
LQIPYPNGYEGAKSMGEGDAEFYISTLPRWLTPGELELANQFVSKLPYPQSVKRMGPVLIDQDDPLLSCDHDALDQAEISAQAPNTRNAPGGGTRSIYERVLLLRETGYMGGANKVLPFNTQEQAE